jgi:hypothetical protein
MLKLPSTLAPESHLPFTLTLNQSHPHSLQNHQLGCFATQSAYSEHHAYVGLRKQLSPGYVPIRLHAARQQHLANKQWQRH